MTLVLIFHIVNGVTAGSDPQDQSIREDGDVGVADR